jgi:regulator of sigma E protease
MVITIVAFLGMLVLLILAHELGHFITAKSSGVKVEEFGIGFPPRLLKVRRGETLYSLNLLPLGGFVKMSGEEDPNLPGSLASKNVPTRLLVLSAGSLMNALLPILLFSITFMIPHEAVREEVWIREVAPNSPAAMAGIQPGDMVLQIDNHPIQNLGDLQRNINLNLGAEISIQIQRDNSPPEMVRVVPRWKPPPGQGAIGIMVGLANPHLVTESYGFWRSISLGARTCLESLILIKNEVTGWFIRGQTPQLAGPVGIAQVTGEVAKAGIIPLIWFAAFLSINLAIINIFPLPALDGGRVMFVLLEVIRRGKRIQPGREALIHLIGFVVLISLVVLVTYFDITRIIRGESLLP